MNLTPKEFNQLATKDDIKAVAENMATKRQVNDLTISIDGLTKAVKDLRDELKTQRFRIKTVEQKVGIDF